MDELVDFAFCCGYRCGKKEDCARYHMHKKLLESVVKKKRTKDKKYVESTVCVRHRHNNFIPADVYRDMVDKGAKIVKT
jgi:hypothetical protein